MRTEGRRARTGDAAATDARRGLPVEARGRLSGVLYGAAPPVGALVPSGHRPYGPVLSGPRVRRAALGQPSGALPPSPLPVRSPDGVAERLCSALRALSARAPVVLAIDDLPYVDPASLRCLLHLTAHARTSRILLVLTESPCQRDADPLVGTELLRHPGFRRVTLGRLTRPGWRGWPSRTTGGRWTPPSRPSSPTSPAETRCCCGRCWRTAARRRPSRQRPRMRRLARRERPVPRGGGGLPGPRRIGRRGDRRRRARLAGPRGPARPARPVRRPAVRGERPGPEIARYLLAARSAERPWAVAALRDAAAEALVEDDTRTALAYLRLAYSACPDTRQRSEIRLALAAATWRVNPPPPSTTSPRCSRRCTPEAPRRWTSAPWPGCSSAAVGWRRRGGAGPAAGPPGRRAARGRLPRVDPVAVRRPAPGRLPSRGEEPVRLPRPHPSGHGRPDVPNLPRAAAVWGLPDRGTSEAAAEAAEQRLRSLPLADSTLVVLANAVRTLFRAGNVTGPSTGAMAWPTRRPAGRLRLAGGVPRGPRGDRPAQGRVARGDGVRRARSAVPARTERQRAHRRPARLPDRRLHRHGRHDEATRLLNHPVPGALFHSVYGLSYLRARGQHHLAMEHREAALADFLNAGRLAGRWGLDHPALLPWRADAARAYLLAGDEDSAATLITEQLARIRPWDDPHSRGMSLRLRAATAAPAERPRLLAAAVEELRRSGDRLEVARTLLDLSTAHQRLGRRRAPTGCAAGPGAWPGVRRQGAVRRHPPGVRRAGEEVSDAVDWPHSGLSGAERRVAALAVNGNTNREIAGILCVTVSTVEQHLTRIYRKLGIARRDQLMRGLHGELSEPSDPAGASAAPHPRYALYENGAGAGTGAAYDEEGRTRRRSTGRRARPGDGSPGGARAGARYPAAVSAASALAWVRQSVTFGWCPPSARPAG
ncbi:helix-turn-helix transcriptional regulator [Streptomyces sp. M19]